MYDAFFAYARERQSALIKKRAGVPKGHQSDDPIINYHKFCNVFREDDRTTIWLRENVREKMIGQPELLLATILFRWFNRITTGEAIFCQTTFDNFTAWEHFLYEMDRDIDDALGILRSSIVSYCGSGPYVTGSYCIIGMPYMPKLDGILACVRNVVEEGGWRTVAGQMLEHRGEMTMESVWDWFRCFPRSGDFMSYEIVTDLQHSPGFLDQAPDRMTWANAGPGAIRGLNRMCGRPLEQQHEKKETNDAMRLILTQTSYSDRWPVEWPRWDMRTVEHTLCEWDKYERLRLGQGRVKGVYR